MPPSLPPFPPSPPSYPPSAPPSAPPSQVEGLEDRHDHKKQWEEYYHMFLQRYTDRGVVTHKKELVARLSGASGGGSSSMIPG